MIYIEGSLEEFFIKFPVLRKITIQKCEELNIDINSVRPFMTKESAGILLNPHEECPKTVATFRNKQRNYKMLSLMNNLK